MSWFSIILIVTFSTVVYYLIDMGVSMQGNPRRRNVSRGWQLSKGFASRLTFNKVFTENESIRKRYELKLVRAGNIYGWTVPDIILLKEVGVIFIGLFLFRMQASIGLILCGMIFGIFAIDIFLNLKIDERKATIQRSLPTFIDLLVLTLESGLDLLAAVERVAEKINAGPLLDELQILLQENRLGTPRKETLEHFAYRTNVTDIQSFTSIVIQSEELGTSLATVLRNYAEDMRSRRISRAEEIAGKAPVKLLFPMVVFFFPIVLIIIFGPMAYNYFYGIN